MNARQMPAPSQSPIKTSHGIPTSLREGKGDSEVLDPARAARRAAMPQTAFLLDEFAAFSPKVIYAVENGIRVGKKPQYTEAFTIPPGYYPMRAIEQPKGRK